MVTNMKRRDFLKISALAGVAVVAAACAPTAVPATAVPATAAPKATDAPKATEAPKATAAPKATEAPKATVVPTKAGFQGEIEFYAQAYTPTSTLANPDPKAPKREAMAVLAKEWMDLHPGVKFTFHQGAPSGQNYTGGWLNTQLIGGTGPDMFWIWLGSLNQFADEGKVVPINDYLELPNKYTPEDKTPWKNTFKSPFQTSFSPKGQWGGVPLDLVSTGVYVNVDMFKSVGIDLAKEIVPELGSPKDWATMISWCKKFKEAGFFAFSMSGYILEWWLQGVLGDQLFWNLTPEFDKLNYYENRPMAFQKDMISQEEIVMQYMCNNWKAFDEPATRTMFEIFKDLSLYMPEGFVAADTMWSAAWDLYLQNKLAMFWDGSWRVGSIMQDDRRKFEFSSFWLPPLTKETTPLAKDPPLLPIGVGGYGSLSYGIHRKCISKGNVDECVDWLMFITTPKNDEMIVNEIPSFIPSNKKAKSLPEVENLFVGETRLVAGAGHPWPAPMGWFSGYESKFTDTFKRELTLYLLDEQDMDTFMANLEAGAQESVPALIRGAAIQYSKDGNWDLTQWTCQPAV
ncbi:MAG: ABC transporter substrate-binding protein [Anaerolineae bacterium]